MTSRDVLGYRQRYQDSMRNLRRNRAIKINPWQGTQQTSQQCANPRLQGASGRASYKGQRRRVGEIGADDTAGGNLG